MSAKTKSPRTERLKPKTSLSYHEAASLERAAILRKVRHVILSVGRDSGKGAALEYIEHFILGRVKRFRSKAGGL
jgi:hypothetical protein